jgi:hypothetical protein
MGSLVDLSDMVNRLTGGNSGTPESPWFQKLARVAGGAPTAPISGRPCSLWTYDGVMWPGGSAPGAVAACDRNTVGALLGWSNPGGGREKKVLQAFCTGLNAGTLILYDRLLHIGGLNATTLTAQTVGGTITRNTGGVGNIAFLEIYSIIGTTATSINMLYTDQDGNTNVSSPTVAFGGTGFREVSRAIMLPLAAGDTGLRAVASVDIVATTGTAGVFGVTIAKPLAYVSIGTAGGPGWRDFTTGLPGIPNIDADACLAGLWIPNSTTPPELFGCITTVEA